MVKLWDVDKILSPDPSEPIEPYFTLRDHFGPIFTLTGNQLPTQENGFEDNLVLTAGSEGIIRVWYIPSPEEISELPDMDSLELSYAIVTAHDETIWDLQYHPCE